MANTTSYVRVIGNEVDNATDDTTYIFNPTDGLKTFTLAGGSDGDTVAISALSTDFKIKVVKNMLTLIGLKNGASAGTIVKIQMDTSNGGVEHLAFLDGKVDVTFTPSAPGSLTGQWTVGGEDIAKKYNFAKQAGNYAIDSTHTYADAAYAASGVLDAQRYLLTTETDDIEITTDNTFDLVRGIIDFSGEDSDQSTVTTLDTIIGNGHTALEIGVHDINSGYDADFICLSGVDKLMIIDGDDSSNAYLCMDASSYGTDISYISLDGNGDMDLCVCNLDFTGQLHIDNANNCSCIELGGISGGLTFDVSVTNCCSFSGTSEAIVGVAGISMDIRECSSIYVDICQTACASTQDVTVGSMLIGDFHADVGVDSIGSLDMCNYACVGHTGDATVGAMSLGNVDIDMGDYACACITMTNCADATCCGDGTAGDLTVGDVAISGALSTYFCGYIYNSAEAYYGTATVGNLTLGNFDIEVGDNSTGLYMTVSNEASATCATGESATAGDLTAGNISFVGGDDYCFWLGLYNSACASGDGATASVGNIVVGDLSFDVGTTGSVCFDALNDACAYWCGEAIAGDVTIGDLDLTAVSSGYFAIQVGNYTVTACTGLNATAGNVSVGNVNVQMNGVYNTLSMTVTNWAYACDAASVGTMTIGDIDVYGGADSLVCVMVYQCASADDAYAGDLTIGNVNIQIENEGTNDCGSAYLSIDACATNLGNITIGDITMAGGTCAYVGVSLTVDASCGNIGDLSIGNVCIAAETDGSGQYYACFCAEDDIGNVNFGNIIVDVNGNDAEICACICLSADYGCIGDIVVGNLIVDVSGDDSCGCICFDVSIEDEIGNVTVGDITINAIGDNANASFVNSITNCYGDIGNVIYGNISIVADGNDACVWACITASGDDCREIGTYTVGDIAMSVSGEDACAQLSMSVTSFETMGLTTVGNITIDLDIDVSSGCDINGSDYAYACYCMCVEEGDLLIGDISVSAAEVTADYDDETDVCVAIGLNVCCGDLEIGDVTVDGGYSNGAVADNFGTLRTWLDIDFYGNGSIGNIDYSDYRSTACIDIDDLDGADIIWAAQDDTDISLNDTKNTVYLGDGSDIVRVGENATNPTLATGIDVIYNFTAGDDIIETGGTSLATGVAANYATFLTSAATQLSGGYDVYVARFGGDTYIAVDTGSNAVDYVVKLVGVTDVLSTGDVGFGI